MPIFDYRNRTRVIYDNFGNPVVGWGNYSFENWGGWINLTKSLNGGISYPGPYYTAYSRERGYDFCFDEDNNFYFCWIDDWERTIEFIKSTDGGITFDTARTVVDASNMGWNLEGGPISILLNSSNTIHIFWSTLSPRRRIWLSKSFDGGETFLTPDTIINFQHLQLGHDVVIVNDEFYLLFRGFISQTNNHLYFSYSTNNGQSFSNPQLIGGTELYYIHYNPLTGLLIRDGSKVYRSLDLGQTFPDTAIIQPDPGYSGGAYSINSDQSGNVYAIGIRSKANTPGKRHIMLKKTDLLVGIPSESSPAIPVHITLKQNYPNPFNSSTLIEYHLPNQANIKLAIFDVTGKEVCRFERGNAPPGNHSFYWDGRTQQGNPVASGLYFYTLRVSVPGQTSQGSLTKKMLLIR